MRRIYNQARRGQDLLRLLFISARLLIIALLLLQCRLVVLAQEVDRKDLRGSKGTCRSGLTGTGAESSSRAATPGGADGTGNPLLGGQRHPLYRLRPSDVVEISFTVAPEFNQTLTVQPDAELVAAARELYGEIRK